MKDESARTEAGLAKLVRRALTDTYEDTSNGDAGEAAPGSIDVSIADEDQGRLDRLAERFADGDRREFLRLAVKNMEALEQAELLNSLAVYGAERLAAKGLTFEDVPDLVHRVVSKPTKE